MRQRALAWAGVLLLSCKPTPPPKPPVAAAVVDAADVAAPEAFEPCAGIDAARDEFEQAHAGEDHEGPGADDHAYPPACEVLDVPSTPEPWADGVAWCDIADEIYGPKTCTLRFARAGKVATVVVESSMAHGDVEITALEARGDHLLVRWQVDDQVQTATCHAHPLACTSAAPAP